MLNDHIKSIRTAVGKEYVKPDEKKIDVFTEDLTNNEEALEYLKKERGFTEETIKHFRLGYDKEKHAISIPVFKNGELVNIKYRFIKPKDLRYTSEKNAETWMYNEEGIEEGRKLKGVLVVEGELDAIASWQAGIKNVISPASGKDSYGVWIALLDNIPKVYVAFDNDEGGKTSGKKFAERVGQGKSYEFQYPNGIKDANEFFKNNDLDSFKELVKLSKPYYAYQFKNVGNVINSIREGEEPTLESQWIPKVRMEKDWLMVLSGDTNVGKTTYGMNIAKDLALQGIPNLVMPFERGIVSVGKRFLQVFFNKTSEDLTFASNKDWDVMLDEVVDLPVYFSTPKKNDIVDTIRKSKRYFDTRVVIIDHLDYIVRNTANTERDIASCLQDYKALGQELGIIFIVITHLRKRDASGRPTTQDLKGSSSLSQDPECVILLSEKEQGIVTVDVAKNKGYMGRYDFGINMDTGVLTHDPDPIFD